MKFFALTLSFMMLGLGACSSRKVADKLSSYDEPSTEEQEFSQLLKKSQSRNSFAKYENQMHCSGSQSAKGAQRCEVFFGNAKRPRNPQMSLQGFEKTKGVESGSSYELFFVEAKLQHVQKKSDQERTF